MKESTMHKFRKTWQQVMSARRTTSYQAAVAHLMGYALEFQYDCCYDSHLDGEESNGQVFSMNLEAVCLKILQADTLHVGSYHGELEQAYSELMHHINGIAA